MGAGGLPGGVPRVALASMDAPPDRAAAEDALVARALADRGVDAEPVPWRAAADWGAYDLVLVRTTWDYTGDRDGFLRWAEAVEAATDLWNPAAVLRWNTHKGYLADLAAARVPVVPTVHVPRGAAPPLADLLAARGWTRAVVKPAVGAAAIGASRVGPGDGARLEALAAEGDVLVQPYLPAIETAGETSLVHVDDRLAHVVRKRPAGGDWRVQPVYGGVAVGAAPTDAELDVAARALAAAPGPRLHARVDLVPGDDGPLLIELELVEPYLYLDEAGAAGLADAVRRRLAR